MPLPRAILFDLDDTLLAYSASAAPVWRQVCGRFVDCLPDVGTEMLIDAIDVERAAFWADPVNHRDGRLDLVGTRRTIVSRSLTRLGVEDHAVGRDLADAFTHEREKALHPFPGAIEAVKQIKSTGVRLALITNGGAVFQRAKVVRFGLEPLFECIVIEGEFGVGKPDPSVYDHALEVLETDPDEAWMVGDNLEWEVVVPQRKGMKGIWVDAAGEGLPEGCDAQPDRIVQCVSELLVDGEGQ